MSMQDSMKKAWANLIHNRYQEFLNREPVPIVSVERQRPNHVTAADVRASAERALELLKEEYQTNPVMMVNWADLRVTDVRHWVDEYGNAGWEVCVEEADDRLLESMIAGMVSAERLTDEPIEVRTEW